MSNKQYLTKITNENLERLIVCAINTKLSNRIPAVYERSWLEALQNKELEIEGYSRKDHLRDATKMVDEWTKFDSCKEDTYPPKEKFLAWGLPDPDCDGTPTEFFCWRDDFGFSCNESAYPEIHFWRPLQPPQESEACK